MRRAKVLGAAALTAGAFGAAASGAAFLGAFFAPHGAGHDPFALPPGGQYAALRGPIHDLVARALAQPFEPVRIAAPDGVPLFGRWYAGRPGAPVSLLFHGYKSSALRDLAGGLAFLRRRGHSVLLVDERAHGRSGGRVITFGVRERLDCAAWAHWAAQRVGPHTPLLLYGISMGAATVLLAGALALPRQVAGIVADSPYTSPKDILCSVCRSAFSLPERLSWPLLCTAARLYGGFDPADADVAAAAAASRVPLLLVHGLADTLVPSGMSRHIRAAAAAAGVSVRLLEVPGAEHGLAFLVDRAAYGAALDAFLQEQLAAWKDKFLSSTEFPR